MPLKITAVPCSDAALTEALAATETGLKDCLTALTAASLAADGKFDDVALNLETAKKALDGAKS